MPENTDQNNSEYGNFLSSVIVLPKSKLNGQYLPWFNQFERPHDQNLNYKRYLWRHITVVCMLNLGLACNGIRQITLMNKTVHQNIALRNCLCALSAQFNFQDTRLLYRQESPFLMCASEVENKSSTKSYLILM